jgi:hypothetical protein
MDKERKREVQATREPGSLRERRQGRLSVTKCVGAMFEVQVAAMMVPVAVAVVGTGTGSDHFP